MAIFCSPVKWSLAILGFWIIVLAMLQKQSGDFQMTIVCSIVKWSMAVLVFWILVSGMLQKQSDDFQITLCRGAG
jgi:hypothetical protein